MYLDRTREQMSVVRKTSCEGRSVVERVLRPALGELQAGFESIYLSPECNDFFLFLGEAELGRDWKKGSDELLRVERSATHCRGPRKTWLR